MINSPSVCVSTCLSTTSTSFASLVSQSVCCVLIYARDLLVSWNQRIKLYSGLRHDTATFAFQQRQQQQQQQQQMMMQGQGQGPGMMGGGQQGMPGQGPGAMGAQMAQPQQQNMLFDDLDLTNVI